MDGSAPRASLLLSLRNTFEVLAVSAPTVVEAARGRLTREACDERLARFARHVVANANLHVTVHGRENAALRPAGGGFVVMSNHQSHYDIPMLYHALGGSMRMVAKKELFALPVFGRAIRDAGMIEVDRGDRERAIRSLNGAKAQLASGMDIWIAPEGTRSVTGELLAFKKGGFILALETEAPILPVTIQGTRDILPVHGLRSRAGGDVAITIHRPVDSAAIAAAHGDTARDVLMREVRAAIASALP